MRSRILTIGMMCAGLVLGGCGGNSEDTSMSDTEMNQQDQAQVEIPAGKAMVVALKNDLSTETTRTGDVFHAALTAPVSVGADVVLPAQTRVSGVVKEVRALGDEGGPKLTLELTSVDHPGGETFQVDTAPLILVSESSTEKDLEKVAIGGVAGGIIGGVVGGKKGAAIGAGVGAGAGTVVALVTGKSDIELATGQKLEFRTEQPLVMPPMMAAAWH